MSDPIQVANLLGQQRERTRVAAWLDPVAPVSSHLLSLSRQRDWQLICLNKFDGRLPESVAVRGVIVSTLPDTPEVAAILEANLPVVRIGSWPHPDDARVPAAMPDKSACGPIAAEYLAERGFRHMACVARQAGGVDLPLFEAFADHAERLGAACHILELATHYAALRRMARPERVAREKQLSIEWLAQLPKPLALLGASDVFSDRYIHWLIEAGMRVPDDVAVISIGNITYTCEGALVPITSIAFEPDRIAEAAVSMLEHLMAGRKLLQTTVKVPPAGVVGRQSTDVLATSDPNVAKAVRFMWDHVSEDLSVSQIAQNVGVSRRKLELAFKREIGRGINAEFQRRRLEKARELLRATELPIHAVAKTLSFSSMTRFGKAFRSAYGLPPTEYRRRERSDA